jgi:hypothetical protein
MRELLVAMGTILASWLFMGTFLVGIGLAVRRAFGLRTGQVMHHWLLAFWVGWVVVLAFLQVWHLWLPAGGWAFGCVAVAGIAGLAWNHQDVRASVRHVVTTHPWLVGLVVLLAVWFSNRAISALIISDTGLYNLQGVRWSGTYPVIPGLGNVESLLGLNTSYFLYAALLEVGPWAHKARHLASGLLLLGMAVQVVWSMARLFRPHAPLWAYHVFTVLLFPPLLRQVIVIQNSSYIASLSTDTPVFLLQVVAAAYLVVLLFDPPDDCRETQYLVFGIILLSVGAVTVKLNSLFFSATMVLVAGGWWVLRNRDNLLQGESSKTLWWVGWAIALLSIPWAVRSVILTGYPLYPSTVIALPVDWRVPPAIATGLITYTQSVTLPLPTVLASPFAAAPLALAGAGVLFRVAYRPRPHVPSAIGWWVLLPPAVCLLVWALTVPYLRYANACFWVLGAGAVTLAVVRPLPIRPVTISMAVLLCAVAIAGLSLVRGGTFDDLLIMPGENRLFDATPQPELSTVTLSSGVVVYVPDTEVSQCWDAPLPCIRSRGISAHLRLREEGEIRHGFKWVQNE